ncbi:hydroxypyruvate isomerase family protein [Massilia sp. W12]|uniref:hydroxypyruvate isomerase family protein n=1 Tax=Massilia sp. W12 TaxID=3126507 RepID=UPI0030CB03A0
MLKFAANLTLMFTEVPMLQRFAAARRAGFEYVEMQLPYAWPAMQLREMLQENQLQMILHNLPAGNWDAGERGIACHPGRIDEYRAGVELGLVYAQTLGVRQLNVLAGIVPEGVTFAQAEQCFLDNLRYTCERMQKCGIKTLIEPINPYNVPGFLLNTTRQALQYLDMLQQPNLFIEYDIYHAQRAEGDLGNILSAHIERIAHIQFADNPGRHQPGTGEINFPYLFKLIEELGYPGYLAAEYIPLGSTEQSLDWANAWLKPQSPLQIVAA